MSEYDFMFEDEAGQMFEDGNLSFEHGTMIHRHEDPDDYITIQVTHVGGRGPTHKTHTGFIRMIQDAIHRTLGNLHSHPKDGGNICKTELTIRREDRDEAAENS